MNEFSLRITATLITPGRKYPWAAKFVFAWLVTDIKSGDQIISLPNSRLYIDETFYPLECLNTILFYFKPGIQLSMKLTKLGNGK